MNSRESLQDKIKEVNEIMNMLGEWRGVDPATGFHMIQLPAGRVIKVADLVDDSDAQADARTDRTQILRSATLETLLHRVFAPAQLDLTIHDRFGHPVPPREWFLVPVQVIDEAVHRIRDGSIEGMVYDPKSARLIES